MKIKNFLIIDDHSLTGKGAALELRHAFPGIAVEIRKSVHGPSGALAYLASMREPCVALTDLHFDDEGNEAGMELLERIKSYPHILPIVLSADTNDAIIKRCRALGAKGYLPKGLDSEEMCTIIERVVAGDTYYPIPAENEPSLFSRSLDALGAKLRPVFDMLVAGWGRAQIADELNLKPGTVKNYISECYEAFDLKGHDNHARLVAMCNKNGYVPKVGASLRK